MKQPNGFQQKKIDRLTNEGKHEELLSYCAQHGFGAPKTPKPIPPPPLLPEPMQPTTERPPIESAPVAVGFPGITTTSRGDSTVVIRNDELAALPRIDGPQESESDGDSVSGPVGNPAQGTPLYADISPAELARIAVGWKRLYDRLEQNAAHSVLNWDETNELNMLLVPHVPPPEVAAVIAAEKPKDAPLPPGQRWAVIVGEAMNRTQKFIKWPDEEKTAPVKILYVKADYGMMHPNRMVGRKVRVKDNPDARAGGFVLV